MKPDLELVQVREDQSFKVWSHGYPYRTVRWHFHPEYELHLVTATEGTCYVGDHIGPFAVGDLVFVGPNLPHNWISNVLPGETVDERCLVLQFTEEFITGCMTTFPELRFVERLLKESARGIRFGASMAARIEPLMRDLLKAEGGRRITLFIEILDLIGNDQARVPVTSSGFSLDPTTYMSSSMNSVLQYIGRSFTHELNEADLARINGQSVSAGLDNSGYPILSEFDTPEWAPPKAQAWASGQVTRFGKKILGVVAANDGTGGGAIAAFKAAGVTPVPPVTGNDATIAALQLIISGDQYNTISKPSEIVASAAAKVAVQLLSGEPPKAEMTLYDTPSQLFTPAVVTAENLKVEIIDKKIMPAATLCTGSYVEGCKKLGLMN